MDKLFYIERANLELAAQQIASKKNLHIHRSSARTSCGETFAIYLSAYDNPTWLYVFIEVNGCPEEQVDAQDAK